MGPRSSGDVRAEPQPRTGRDGFRDLSCSRKSQVEHVSAAPGEGETKELFCGVWLIDRDRLLQGSAPLA